jgi:hypothetical protein
MWKRPEWLLVGLLWACSAPQDLPEVLSGEMDTQLVAGDQSKAGQSRTDQKAIIVRSMEEKMRILLGQAVRRFEEVHDRFARELDALVVPPKIQAVEKELSDFYHQRETVYEERVQSIIDKYEAELISTLGYLEPKVWEVAFEVVGSEDMGISFGSRTGIDEVDESAESTLELIHFRSGQDRLINDGAFAKQNRLFMDRIYKNDIEEVGRLSIYVSDPMRHYFRKDDDAIAVSVAFQKKGLDPKIPLAFHQLVRNRVVRGGSVWFDSRFHWDETLGSPDGRLRLEEAPGSTEVVVSKVFYPRINMDHPESDKLRDFSAIRDYKTAVVNTQTGEVIDCVSWQYMWNISHFGAVAVEKGEPPQRDEEAEEIQSFLNAARR